MKMNFLRSLVLGKARKFHKAFFIWLLIAAQACNEAADPIPFGADGYFVVNEGAFNGSNTSISFFDRESGVMTNNVFAAKNGRPLGDQAQSITVYEGNAYVVVQHSAKVEVINADDYSSLKTITEGIESPRYLIGINPGKAYLSDWGADGVTGTVKVIDLNSFKVTKTIATGQGANRMILKGTNVYVANNGGFGYDKTISIINTTTDAVTSTITVGDNPNSLQFDKDGNLWVVSSGALAYNEDFSIDEDNSTPSSISKIGTNNQETLRLSFSNFTYSGANSLEINTTGDKLFFNYDGAVYSIASSATTLPATPFIDKTFYGLAVDPFNDDIIGTEAINFSSPGKIYVYNAAGSLQRSIEVGIAPNGIGFK